MEIIDCQTHLFFREYAQFFEKYPSKTTIRTSAGRFDIGFDDNVSMVMNSDNFALPNKIKSMDAAQVDVSIIGSNMPGPEMLPFALRAEGARIINDAMAEACATHPTRLYGLASLPFSTIEETLHEYEYAKSIGMRGVQFFSHLSGTQVDDEELAPLFDRIEKDGMVIVLHPTVPEWARQIRDYSMIPMVGYMVDHSMAMLRLILSGTLERYPKLKILQPHCGGILPYLMPRIDEQTEVKRRGRDHIKKAPSQYYQSVYLDVVSPSANTARFAFDYQGSGNMVFGSDHPWVEIQEMIDVVNQMHLSDEQRERLFSTNARQLFNLH